MGGPYARGESETSSATARVNAERAKPAWACYAQPVRYADGENFTIDLERTVAVARVFRNPAIHGPALGAAAQSLLAVGRKLSVESGVSGMVLDLRRVPGAVGPHVEAAYGSLAGVWEATGQPFAFLVEDAVQRMQLVRLVENVAPRMGGIFQRRDDARRFVGAVDADPTTSIGGAERMRSPMPSRPDSRR